jgi:hypothetical protein
VVVLAFVVAASGACVPAPLPTTLPPTPTATVPAARNVPQGWVTLCDLSAGCTFAYPPGADVVSGASKFGIHTIRIQFNGSDTDGYQGMAIRIIPTESEETLDQVLRQVYESSTQTLSFDEWLKQVEEIDVEGVHALRSTCAVGSTDFSVIIPYGDRIFVASPTHGPAVACVDDPALETFYQILGTLVVEE